MRHTILSSLTCPVLSYFFHTSSQTAWFSEKKEKLLKVKCLIWLSLQLLLETFLILRSIYRDFVINMHMSSCKIRYTSSCKIRYISSCKIRYTSSCKIRYTSSCKIRYTSSCKIRYTSSCKIRYTSQILMKLELSRLIFPKIFKYPFPWKSFLYTPSYSMWTDGRAIRCGEDNRLFFSQFCERTKNM